MSALVLSIEFVNLCDYPESFCFLHNLPIATEMPPDSRSVATFTHLSRFSKVRMTSRISQGRSRKCIGAKTVIQMGGGKGEQRTVFKMS